MQNETKYKPQQNNEEQTVDIKQLIFIFQKFYNLIINEESKLLLKFKLNISTFVKIIDFWIILIFC